MRLALALLISLSVTRSAWASDLDDLRLRPSYQKLHMACTQQSDFKLDYYYQAYVQSLQASLNFLLLTKSGIRSLISSEGVSPFLHGLLENPTTSLALNDCYNGNLSDQNAFIRDMLIADGAGKLVAISIAGVAIVGARKIAGKAYSALASISPNLARKLLVATTLATSSFAIKQLMREQEVQDETPTPDIKGIYSKKLVDAANEQLTKLHELAKDDSLNADDRAEVEKEIHNWTLVLEKFSAA